MSRTCWAALRRAFSHWPLPRRCSGRVLGRGAGVAADHVQLRDRHVELVAALVLEVQELRRALAQVQRHEPQVAADAVLAVHDRIAGLDLGQVAQHALGAELRARPSRRRDWRTCDGIELGLGDDREALVGRQEPRGERPVREHERRGRLREPRPVVDQRRVQPVLAEELQERLAAAGAVGDDEHAPGERGHERARARRGSADRRSTPTSGRSAARSAGRRRARPGRAALHVEARQRLQRDEELLRRQVELRRGGSSGRSRSPRSSSQRLRRSRQNASAPAGTSSCSTHVAPGGR